MARKRNIDPEVARWRAKRAANARWSRAGSHEAASETGKRRVQRVWETKVDPDGVLPVDVRQKLAAAALRTEMSRISLAGQVKRARAQAAAPPEDSGDAA